MAVVIVEDGKVVQVLRDVKNVTAARKKYPHLRTAYLVSADELPGTLFAAGKFTAPAIIPRAPKPESDVILALRDLAEYFGPETKAKLEERLGSRRP